MILSKKQLWIRVIFAFGLVVFFFNYLGPLWFFGASEPPDGFIFGKFAVLIWLLVFTCYAFAFRSTHVILREKNVSVFISFIGLHIGFIASCILSSIIFPEGTPFIPMIIALLAPWPSSLGSRIFLVCTITPTLFYLFRIIFIYNTPLFTEESPQNSNEGISVMVHRKKQLFIRVIFACCFVLFFFNCLDPYFFGGENSFDEFVSDNVVMSIWLLIFVLHAFASRLMYVTSTAKNAPAPVSFIASCIGFTISCIFSSMIYSDGTPFNLMISALHEPWFKTRHQGVFLVCSITPALFYLFYVIFTYKSPPDIEEGS